MGDIVHHRLDAKEPLGIRRGAEVPRDSAIGVDRIDRALDVCAVVELETADAPAVLPVAAHAAVATELDRGEGAIVGHPNFVVLHRGPATVHPQPVFLAGELENHRCPHALGKHRGNEVGVLVLILVAKATAHVLTDDPDVVLAQTKVSCGVVPTVRDSLSRRIERELLALPVRQADPAFHLRIVDKRRPIPVFEDAVGLLESQVEVTAGDHHRLELAVDVRRQVAFGPEVDSVWLERCLGVEDKRQLFIVDRDELEGFFGHMAVDSDDCSDRFSDKPHGIIEQMSSVGRDGLHRVVVLTSAGHGPGPPDDVGRFVGDDRFHAGHPFCQREIDAPYPCVRMGAAQHPAIEHPRQPDVGGVGGSSGDPFDRIYARRDVADRRARRRGLVCRRPDSRRVRLRAPGGGGDGFDDRVVVRAPTQVTGHCGANGGWVGVRVAGQETCRRHQLTRRTEPTLWSVVVDKCLLEGRELTPIFAVESVARQPFDRLDRDAVRPDGQLAARIDGMTVHQDRTGATFTPVATDLRSRQLEVVAE